MRRYSQKLAEVGKTICCLFCRAEAKKQVDAPYRRAGYIHAVTAQFREGEKNMDFKTKMLEMLMSDYEINHEVAEIVFNRAYEDGHYAGEHEVQNYCSIYGQFAEDILNAK